MRLWWWRAFWALAWVPARAATVTIDYLALAPTHHIATTALEPPPTDTGVQGARLAAADNATTGRFLDQTFALTETVAPDEATLHASFNAALKAGQRLFVLDVPSKLVTALADEPEAAHAILLDATSPDDALRGADCRRNVLHTAPSRAMLADALMQYLAVKDWRRILLLVGKTEADGLYAEAIRHAAQKFQVTVKDDRRWDFNPAAQQADTGHYQVNDEVAKATQGVAYDVLVVADEDGAFGNALAYRTVAPRPVAGTQGLVPAAWAKPMDEYASTQLQARFLKQAHRFMTARDYTAWLAVRAIGEAATRTRSVDPDKIIAYIDSPEFQLSGYKGLELSFRAWDGQLRQPVLLADADSLISISPQPGFLHEINELDSLGTDKPETQCTHH